MRISTFQDVAETMRSAGQAIEMATERPADGLSIRQAMQLGLTMRRASMYLYRTAQAVAEVTKGNDEDMPFGRL